MKVFFDAFWKDISQMDCISSIYSGAMREMRKPTCMALQLLFLQSWDTAKNGQEQIYASYLTILKSWIAPHEKQEPSFKEAWSQHFASKQKMNCLEVSPLTLKTKTNNKQTKKKKKRGNLRHLNFWICMMRVSVSKTKRNPGCSPDFRDKFDTLEFRRRYLPPA